jgi:hypothetical protein
MLLCWQKAEGSQERPSFLPSVYRLLLTALCFLLSAYSYLSATSGSTFVARRAGIQQASSSAMTMNDRGSVALTLPKLQQRRHHLRQIGPD